MYAKIMSISDELMWRYYELLSQKSLEELQAMREGVRSGNLHPKSVKQNLAHEITARFHGAGAAEMAQIEFDQVFSRNQMPSEFPVVEFSTQDSGVWICKILQESGLCPSSSQARRDIQAGACKIDGQKVLDENLKLTQGEYVLQIGKRKFVKAIIL